MKAESAFEDNPRHEPAARSDCTPTPSSAGASSPRDIVPPARTPAAHQPGHRRAQARHAGADRGSAGARAAGAVVLPPHAGRTALREAIAGWVQRRYGVTLDAGTQVLPVNGSREALFAFAQTVIDPTRPGATVVCPNPFYQIYEGAALLAGAQTGLRSPATRRATSLPTGRAIDDATWARTQLLYVCSPGNPTGAVMPLAEWAAAVRAERPPRLRHRQRRVLFRDLLRRASRRWARCRPRGALGRDDFRNLVAFTSLSKRSNVPGLRSGFVAGDAALLKAFLLYRTYHGSAMSPVVQARQHRGLERRGACGGQPRAVPRQVRRASRRCWRACSTSALPDAGFYLWAGVPRRRRRRVRPRPARSIQCRRCCRAACSRAQRRTASTRAHGPRPHGAGGRRSTNASKPPSASSPTPQSLRA
ncbi:MAG: aminotransferase class I/II-fold pyridoxal phosphate-dependent enzyme [Comamonadaceae bacterium]|nr:aminotransferase class I/II-fold pyridoxal phosphate-dependent enzyme [Comamonadaceae bacterium]